MTLQALILVGLVMLAGCIQPPNKPICADDTPVTYTAGATEDRVESRLSQGICVWSVSGPDFHVDDTGQRNYKEDGHDWKWTDLKKHSLVLPPDSWAAFKRHFLEECHNNSGCNLQSLQSHLDAVEGLLTKHE